MERKVDVIKDLNGNEIVIIQDIIFKGKTSIILMPGMVGIDMNLDLHYQYLMN